MVFMIANLPRALLTVLFALAVSHPLMPAHRAQGNGYPIDAAGGYPGLRLHGRPFFAHSAAFFYNRIPRDEWAESLVRLKRMGINTIDLYIAWNWHEPEEGKLDFDGRTNPRKDIRGLLGMLDRMGFAVIARPGPVILNEWRNGGYPDWLLERPEYRMHPAARLDGHYPPLSSVSASNSEEASRSWLTNETHLRYTKRWFGDVMRELLKARQATEGGNLIAIQLDDDQAINRANYNGPVFWKYMTALAGYLREAGATVPLYINPTDMRVSAAGAPHGIGAMGQWYYNFGADPSLRWEDTATLQFYTETLRTQPHFPPMIIEYQAGWYGTGDDSYAKAADPTNTLLSSRVMIGNGLRGLNYFPVQDTLYPAGYEVPWANHYYIWESALTLAGDERPRAAAIHRNGRMAAGLGPELALTHKAADIGLVYPIGSFDQPSLTREEIFRISRAQMQIQQFCQLNQISVEYLDPEYQPLEHLLRHRAILLPVFDAPAASALEAKGREEITAANEPTQGRPAAPAPAQPGRGRLRLSEAAQRKLADYVRRGGRLIVTPGLPKGDILGEALGGREVIVVPDFWRSVPVEPGKTDRAALVSSIQSSAVEFVSRLARAGVNRRVKARISSRPGAVPAESVGSTIEPDFVSTMLVGPKPGYAFVSVTSFDSSNPMKVSLNIADPAGPESPAARLTLPEFELLPRDSMMVPIRVPVEDSGAEILYATAELVRREYANGRLRLRFYSPSAAEVVIALPRAPEGPVTVDGSPVAARYDGETSRLRIAIPAGEKSGDRPPAAERDVEIVCEKSAPELKILSDRLIIGEANRVSVEVRNTTSQPLAGELELSVSRGLKRFTLAQKAELKPMESRAVQFELPVADDDLPGDFVLLRATLRPGGGRPNRHSPEAELEIMPRFAWEALPASYWPLRSDTRQRISPPLIYPKDDNAAEAELNLRLTGNSNEPVTLTRSSLLVNSLPLKLGREEQIVNTFIYGFPAATRSVLHPFAVNISDGRSTVTARATFVALRRNQAVAFAYDIDRDGFDDYVLENDRLRLIVSPRAGARSFALINKKTGANLFTSVGGLRDKFVELDPADPTRNPRRKRGMYGTFNRPYSVEIVEAMGPRASIRLACDAPDIYPAGLSIERVITLPAGEELFTVDYKITAPDRTADGVQALRSSTSIPAGDPAFSRAEFNHPHPGSAFKPAGSVPAPVDSGLVFCRLDDRNSFALAWNPSQLKFADIEMKDFSTLINLSFKELKPGSNLYRLAVYCGSDPIDRVAARALNFLPR